MKSKHKFIIVTTVCILLISFGLLNLPSKVILPDGDFAFSPTPSNGQSGGVEGIYYHRASSPMEILDEVSCKIDGWDNCTQYDVLRFYSDGTVISVAIATDDGITADDMPKLQKWFRRDETEFPTGKYFISGKHIWFSATTNTVVTDYSGIVLGNSLLLSGYSHYTQLKLNNMVFFRLNNGDER